jgi:epoxyqueuosine reductase
VERLRQQGEEAGLAAVGVAPATPMARARRVLEQRKAEGLDGGMQFTYRNPARSTDPSRVLPGAAALVVGAWWYGEAAPLTPAGERPRGRVARYAWRDHYAGLRGALGQLADILRASGWAARVVADDNALVDRAAATGAGLGWYGKNTNVLLPGRGSWFVLGSVVTDAPLPPDAPGPAGSEMGDGCGPCRRCLGACPTGALVAPGALDARRCLAWLVQAPGVFPFEYRAALGDRIYGCDDCQEVCPPNRVALRLARRPERGPSRRHGDVEAESASEVEGERQSEVESGRQSEVDLLDVLVTTDAWLLARYGRWYIPGRDPAYLRRNALIALANTADGRSPAVEPVLKRYLTSPDERLRAHAVWAALRLGRSDLLDGPRPEGAAPLADDPSQLVQAELRRRPEVVPRVVSQMRPDPARHGG